MKARQTYSTKEVAREVGIHWVTLLRWLSEGKVHPSIGVPMNGQTLWRWTAADVERVRKYKTAHYGEGKGPRKKAKKKSGNR